MEGTLEQRQGSYPMSLQMLLKTHHKTSLTITSYDYGKILNLQLRRNLRFEGGKRVPFSSQVNPLHNRQ
jgi:hypothetical protein